MHGLVLERGVDPFSPAHGAMRLPREVERRLPQRRHNRIVGAIAIREHFAARWPHRRGAAARHGLFDAVGIDAALEEALHLRVDTRRSQAALEQRDHAERGKMPFVKNDGIAQGDRPRVVRVRIEHVEELARPGTIAAIPVDEQGAIDSRRSESRGGRGQSFPFQRFEPFPELRRR